MAQPPPYDRSYNFHDYQAENPLKPLPADKLDEEFSRVKTTIDAVLQNLALIQRDDTALANKSVGYDQLKDEIQLGFNPPTDWTANHNYVVRDTVFVDVSIYRCLVSHISSNDFEDDLNAGYWELVVDFASVQTTAIAARDAALQAQADAEVAQQAAEDARDAALLAQSGAESARDAAIGAKDDALLAKSGAESARDAAVVAQGLAEAAQADAEAARDDAVVAQGLAEAAQAGAENAADRAEQAASDVEHPVSYAPQTLDPSERAQARANIAALSYESQSLNNSQRTQARANIHAPERIVLDVVAPGGAGVGGAVPLTLLNNKAYTIRLNTIGTGAMTGAVYNLWRDSSVWQLKRLSGISTLNHPELRLNSDGNGLEVFTQHTNDYTIRLHIDAWDVNNPNGIAERFFDPFYTKEESDQRYATAAQGTKADNAVSYAPQTLSPSEQAQARENIAAVGYAEQSLSPAEQRQARANIGIRSLTGADYVFPAIDYGRTVIEPGTQDESIREIGNVFFDEDDEQYPWKLTYSGHQGAYQQDTVYVFGAKSSDGKTWQKVGKLVERSSEDPYVVKHDGVYYMFVEDKGEVPFRNVRLHTATNFEGPWTDQGDVLEYEPGTWESRDVSSPTVWVENGTWYMLYEGRGESGSQDGAIGLATASDPAGPWTKNPANPVITGWQTAPGPAGWAHHLVPDDIRKIDGRYFLSFHGLASQWHTLGTSRLGWFAGMLTSEDLTNWHDPLGAPISVPILTSGGAPVDSLMFNEAGEELSLMSVDYSAGMRMHRPAQVKNFFRAGSRLEGWTLPDGSWTEIPLENVTADSLNGWDAGNNEWVCKRSGLYRISATLHVGAIVPGSRLGVQLSVKGMEETDYLLGHGAGAVSASETSVNTAVVTGETLVLNAGDKLKFFGYSNGGTFGALSFLVRIEMMY